MKARQQVKMLVLAACFCSLPVLASAAASVAVLPLQELREGRNDANLPFTRILADRLAESGNRIIGLDTVIAFMANNRIRTLGHLDTFRIAQVKGDLGAAFVLLGTVSQQKEKPEPSMGLTLNLVRTSDSRTVWSYVGSVSTGEERRILGIGEPQSVLELQSLLLAEIVEQWPWQIINDVQEGGSINIDSVILEPKQVRPGDEVHGRVRLRKNWPEGQAPRVFFKANEQLFPATFSPGANTFEGTWVAGDENGRFAVNLLLEWPLYGRTESALLGTYLIDGTAPLFEIELAGVQNLDGMPTFDRNLAILPRVLVRKPMARWRLSFFYEAGNPVGSMEGAGNLPKRFTWPGLGLEDGIYQVVLEAWDKAGNTGKASRKVAINRSVPEVGLAVKRNETGMNVDLQGDGEVPLAYWRLEMWTKEGKFLTNAEGKDLPAKVGVKFPEAEKSPEIQGVLVIEDVLGRQVRQKVEDLLPKLEVQAEAKAKPVEKQPKTVSEKWVNEF